jgi:hypothetical protein
MYQHTSEGLMRLEETKSGIHLRPNISLTSITYHYLSYSYIFEEIELSQINYTITLGYYEIV